MFRVQMGRIAARRAAYKRGFSSEASKDKSSKKDDWFKKAFFVLLKRMRLDSVAIFGLAMTAYSSMWIHINGLQDKSEANFKELRAESQAKQDKFEANFKELLAKSDANVKELRAESQANFKELRAESEANFKELRAESDARFNAQLEQIKAIIKYASSSRIVFCQSTTTTSGELAQCLEKDSPFFDMTPATPHKREH